MPKKRQPHALLTKPQASAPSSLSTKATSSRSHDSAPPSVNDLIRESRRLQLKKEPQPANATTIASIPPALRAVLDLPSPPVPSPRTGRPSARPSRTRRIPGPPPPRSWLVDSAHAPAPREMVPTEQGRRLQTRISSLPNGTFPSDRSLQHLAMKYMATSWDFHAEFDLEYLGTLPTSIKETLLSYIAIYNDKPSANPLRLLFLTQSSSADRQEVSRLDLSGGIGTWTSLRQLDRDLRSSGGQTSAPVAKLVAGESGSNDVLESWEMSDDDIPDCLPRMPTSWANPMFCNLKHLSLAINPGSKASWADLLQLVGKVSTISSLSLAYWPQPTLTPNAAATRTVIRPTGSGPSVIYGGSDMYTALDDNWREAAGILRSLSRTLYCLKWLDLTGCGDWLAALAWRPFPHGADCGPDWNGSWRGIDHVKLGVGWTPVKPDPEPQSSVHLDEAGDGPQSWNVEEERSSYRYRKDVEAYEEIRSRARGVAEKIRVIRKASGGKWIEFDFGND